MYPGSSALRKAASRGRTTATRSSCIHTQTTWPTQGQLHCTRSFRNVSSQTRESCSRTCQWGCRSTVSMLASTCTRQAESHAVCRPLSWCAVLCCAVLCCASLVVIQRVVCVAVDQHVGCLYQQYHVTIRHFLEREKEKDSKRTIDVISRDSKGLKFSPQYTHVL